MVADTRVAFDASPRAELATITMAYYPDTRQERLLLKHGIVDSVDLVHAMSYDQNGKHHSSLEFGKKTGDQAVQANLPVQKVTMGLPFYGRYAAGPKNGDWVTYEDIVQKYHPLDPSKDGLRDPEVQRAPLMFNGVDTIQEKVRYAKQLGLGGVMIWEAGQDCRMNAVTRHGTTHVATCPQGAGSSLLVAIATAGGEEEGQSEGRADGEL